MPNKRKKTPCKKQKQHSKSSAPDSDGKRESVCGNESIKMNEKGEAICVHVRKYQPNSDQGNKRKKKQCRQSETRHGKICSMQSPLHQPPDSSLLMLAKEILQSDYEKYLKSPPNNIISKLREDMLEWHFLFIGFGGSPFEGGEYHGVFAFPEDFPFSPPSIRFITPNGRFKVNEKLSFEFSDFHPELWKLEYTVPGLLEGVYSFMMDQTIDTVGSLSWDENEIRSLASKSKCFNGNNRLFNELFCNQFANPTYSTDPCSQSEDTNSFEIVKKRQRTHGKKQKPQAESSAPDSDEKGENVCGNESVEMNEKGVAISVHVRKYQPNSDQGSKGKKEQCRQSETRHGTICSMRSPLHQPPDSSSLMLAKRKLQSDYEKYLKSPPNNIISKLREDMLEWHFLFIGLEGSPFEGGEYHGVFVFPEKYPFSPPSIRFITPNGRFKVNEKLGFEFSDFHPEFWKPAYTVPGMLEGVYCFMMDQTTYIMGSLSWDENEIRSLASKSKEFNLNDILFCELFGDQLVFPTNSTDPCSQTKVTNSFEIVKKGNKTPGKKQKQQADSSAPDSDGKRENVCGNDSIEMNEKGEAKCVHVRMYQSNSVRCLDCISEQKEDEDVKEEKEDLWLCMQCLETRCGRYSTNSHSVKHYEADNNHCLALSIANLQIWCYNCDAFIDPHLVKGKLESVTCAAKKAFGSKQIKPKAQSYPKEETRTVDCKETTTKSMRVIGLNNLGNTCYFNSALQNLLYLRPFRDQLARTMTRTEYTLVPKKHSDLLVITFTYANNQAAEPGKLTKELHNLIGQTLQCEAIGASRYQKCLSVTPWSVRNEISRKYGKFSDGSQQDSRELLRFLIDMVKDEEIQRLKTAFMEHLKVSTEERKKLEKYTSEFENTSVFTGTFIDEIFGGKRICRVQCLKCGNTFDLIEDFLDISLPLPAVSEKCRSNTNRKPQNKNNPCQTTAKDEIMGINGSRSIPQKFPKAESEAESNSEENEIKVKSKEVKRLKELPEYPEGSLEYYLMRFFSPEILENDYVCTKCNPQLASGDKPDTEGNEDSKSIDLETLQFSDAVKQFHMKTLPPVLAIHLKRFSQSGFRLQKVNAHVEFPLVLDMAPFCTANTPVPRDHADQILYGLRGIVSHSGGMVAGHYVAYVNIADWDVPSEMYSDDIAKCNVHEEFSTDQTMATNPDQRNVDNNMDFAAEDNTHHEQLPQPIPPLTTPDIHLHEHVTPSEDWYYISDSHYSRTDHDNVFSTQAYILFYEKLPLV